MSDVDTPEVTAIEWFYGYGGNSIGLHRVIENLRVVAACEIEGYAVANLVAKAEGRWVDPVPCWSDCKTFPCEIFRGRIDLFIASYPCQGFSAAGRREGKRDPRFLWPWVFRAIVIIRPGRVFLENVEGHVSLGLSTVISDLEEAGYRVEAGLFSAEECGAPHRRKRVFILAQRGDLADAAIGGKRQRLRLEATSGAGRESRTEGHGAPMADANPSKQTRNDLALQRRPESGAGLENGGAELADSRRSANERRGGTGPLRGATSEAESLGNQREWSRDAISDEGEAVDHPTGSRRDATRERPAALQQSGECVPREGCGTMGNANQSGLEGRELRGCERPHERATWERERAVLPSWPPGPGDLEEWRRVLEIDPSLEPALCGVADGSANRVDRLRLCGNGVVPDTAAKAFYTLYGRMNP